MVVSVNSTGIDITSSFGACSKKVAFLAEISNDLTCSHIITPVVCIPLAKDTWRGKPLSVLVIGHRYFSQLQEEDNTGPLKPTLTGKPSFEINYMKWYT
jgi:hypothetical protein